jgi:hypothetical protein
VSDSVETSFEARALEGADIQLLVSLTRPPPLGFAPLFLLVFAINLAVVVLAARWLAELADRDAAAEGRGGVGIGMGPYRVFRPGISRIRATDRQSGGATWHEPAGTAASIFGHGSPEFAAAGCCCGPCVRARGQ